MNNIDELCKMHDQAHADGDQVKPKSQASILLEICCTQELFHSQQSEPCITVNVNGRLETFLLSSKDCRAWLREQYFTLTGKGVKDAVIQDAVQTASGIALFQKPKHSVFYRTAQVAGKTYLDLADRNRRVIEIDIDGWRILDQSPVKFRRNGNTQALPTPIQSASAYASINLLKKYLNVGSEDDFKLLTTWLTTSLGTGGPYLVLILYGEQGTAKSTAVKILRQLIDPNEVPLRRPPKNTDDLMVAAKANFVVAFDNMSNLPEWLSDDLCVLSTGGGISKRKLFTDDEEVVLDGKRPIIANGISEFVARGDLVSRSVILTLPRIAGKTRRSEQDIWSEFTNDSPKIFGALLDGIVAGKKNAATVQLDDQPRMVDAWKFITAAETAFGWPTNSCFEAFKRNQVEANKVVLSASPIFEFVRAYASTSFHGSPTELFNKMRAEYLQFGITRHQEKFMPGTVRKLTDELRRLSEALKAVGIEVVEGKTSGSNSQRFIGLKYVGSCDASVACDAPETSDTPKRFCPVPYQSPPPPLPPPFK